MAHSDPVPLVDANGHVFAVLVGQPKDPAYTASTCKAYDAIIREGIAASFLSSMKHHHRGLFAAINVGLSYGQGQVVPSWLHNDEYDGVADRLLANEHVARMATFASGNC
jgi:hypothetical protein